MGHTKDKKPSLNNTSKAGTQETQEKDKESKIVKRANQKFVWVCGLVLALFPVLLCIGLGIIHFDDEEMVKAYKAFVYEFFASGSFLWLSITLLATSLLELLLYGFSEGLSNVQKSKSKKFVVAFILLIVVGIYIYHDNIASPINATTMFVVSLVFFILFAISSRIVSFKLVKEV